MNERKRKREREGENDVYRTKDHWTDLAAHSSHENQHISYYVHIKIIQEILKPTKKLQNHKNFLFSILSALRMAFELALALHLIWNFDSTHGYSEQHYGFEWWSTCDFVDSIELAHTQHVTHSLEKNKENFGAFGCDAVVSSMYLPFSCIGRCCYLHYICSQY